MNPTNGKGDKNLHKRQQCSDEQMLSNWERAFGKKEKTDRPNNDEKSIGGGCSSKKPGDTGSI